MGRRLYAFALVILAAALPAHGADGTTSRLSNGSATDQQSSPAISGTDVVWTDVNTTSGSNFDIFYYSLQTMAPPLNLTNTPGDQEFLEDIDGSNVVWTHTNSIVPGDIVVYDLAAGTTSTVASSTSAVHFEQPSIRGNWVTFLRVTASQNDVYLYDLDTGPIGLVTNDAATQGRPRVGGDFVVYEDYGSGNADVYGWQISTGGPAFPIATGPDSQVTPDLDGNTVVYVENVGGSDQLFAYDLVAKTTRQLTTAASTKVLPRISGNRIVWSDDRNGNLDLYMYDLSTSTESPLVTGTGDQFLSDIDGDRVVYTDNAAGFEQVFLFTFSDPPPPPPPDLPEGCDPTKTDAVGAPVAMSRTSHRPVYAEGTFTADPKKTYWVCVDNGRPDGSQRTTQFAFDVDRRTVLTPSDFRPLHDPPRHVAKRLFALRCMMKRQGDDDDHDDHSGHPEQHSWSASLFGRTLPTSATVTIRVSK